MKRGHRLQTVIVKKYASSVCCPYHPEHLIYKTRAANKNGENIYDCSKDGILVKIIHRAKL